MSIRTSSLRYWWPLVLVAACSTDRVAAPPSRNITPKFSFTGQSTNGRLAFVSDRDHPAPSRFHIYTVAADGTDLRRLTGPEDFAAAERPAFSADGSKIAFEGYLQTAEGGREIWTMNADGTNKVRLTVNPASDMAPEWSPDGTRIAFASDRSGSMQLWAMDADGSDLTQLSFNGLGEVQSSWSSDGSKILFYGFCGDPPASGLCTVPGDGSAPPTFLMGDRNGFMGWPSWSPDGTKILFAGTYNFMSAIWIINPDGTGESPLFRDGGVSPRWSPDGTKIIFEKSFGILTMNADGSDVRAFTTNDILGPYNRTPYWGPAPPAPKQCADGVDNDSDTQTDYPADPGCSSATDDDEADPPPPPAMCADGIDNDGDTKLDYPADPGCTSATDDDETDPPPPPPTFQCSDGLDNDTDGLTDYPADPGCSSATDDDEVNKKGGGAGGGGGGGGGPAPKPPPQCSDGIDNDGDGNIDLADAQCRNGKDNDEGR